MPMQILLLRYVQQVYVLLTSLYFFILSLSLSLSFNSEDAEKH